MDSPELNVFVSMRKFYMNFAYKLRDDGRVFMMTDNYRDNIIDALLSSMGFYSRALNLISTSLGIMMIQDDLETEEEMINEFSRIMAHEYIHYTIFEVTESDGVVIGMFQVEGVIDNLLR